ncbi:hypothetical protein [Prevotella nigrescens]|uniref:hypothetical protein n=1 Tax=Prevotella nigrescens TaxID=28133 RepID=UPI001C5F94D2|nr:hypothetical protein [Prevotella nigrescens]
MINSWLAFYVTIPIVSLIKTMGFTSEKGLFYAPKEPVLKSNSGYLASQGNRYGGIEPVS